MGSGVLTGIHRRASGDHGVAATFSASGRGKRLVIGREDRAWD